MEPQKINSRLQVGGFVLLFAALLVSAAVLNRYKKKKQSLPSESCADFDRGDFDRNDCQQGPFTDPEDLYAFHRSRIQAYEARNATPLTTA